MIKDIEICTHFLNTLSWLCHVMTRYPNDFSFALVRIAYGDRHLGDAYGAPEALNYLSSLTIDLQKTFRSSDLVGRKGTDFWVIFPYTRFGENMLEKLLEVLQSASHQNLNIVDREIAVFQLPDLFIQAQFNPEDSESLIAFLKQNQTKLASHIFRLDSA